MITKDEILKQIEKSKYKISGRTFNYYRELNLIPQPEQRINRKGLYPDYIPRVIKEIRELQEKGFSLEKIKEITSQTIDHISNARKERYNKVCQCLGLKNEGQSYTVYHLKDNDIGVNGVVTVFDKDRVTWFNVDHPHPTIKFNSELRIIEQKTMSLEEYGNFISSLSIEIGRKEHRLLKETDIFKALFKKIAA
jgi:DNA-binding transcriptional MerR regulator